MSLQVEKLEHNMAKLTIEVHQVAHFDIPYHLSNESMRKALNSILPLDI